MLLKVRQNVHLEHVLILLLAIVIQPVQIISLVVYLMEPNVLIQLFALNSLHKEPWIRTK